MNKVYALRLKFEQDDLFYQYLLFKMNNDRRTEIQKYLRKEDAYRSLFAAYLARYAIIENTGLDNNDIVFGYSDHGKPFLLGTYQLHFNVAHSGEWVVCTIDSCPVGIDIEYVLPIDLDISKNYFSPKEHRNLLQKNAAEQLGYFYELWTLKESYIKQAGKGISIPLDSFNIQIADDKSVFMELDNEVDKSIYFKQYDINVNYKMAVCGLNHCAEVVQMISMQEVADIF